MDHHPFQQTDPRVSGEPSPGVGRRAAGQGKPVIGLAGGIGSGKSLVAKQFEELGCAIINADTLAHQVLANDDVRQAIVSWWGDKVLDDQGLIDRKAVGRCVFGSDENLQKLERLVHPRVHALREKLRQRYQSQDQVKAIVEDCPLLFEVGLQKQCDVVVFVATDKKTRLARIMATRGWTQEEVESREKKQLGLDIKAKRADHVVDNSGDQLQTFNQVRSVFLKIITKSRRQSE